MSFGIKIKLPPIFLPEKPLSLVSERSHVRPLPVSTNCMSTSTLSFSSSIPDRMDLAFREVARCPHSHAKIFLVIVLSSAICSVHIPLTPPQIKPIIVPSPQIKLAKLAKITCMSCATILELCLSQFVVIVHDPLPELRNPLLRAAQSASQSCANHRTEPIRRHYCV